MKRSGYVKKTGKALSSVAVNLASLGFAGMVFSDDNIGVTIGLIAVAFGGILFLFGLILEGESL